LCKMLTESSKSKLVALIIVTLIVLSLISSHSAFGVRVCCEGDRWLHWTNEMRQQYVWAYIQGYLEGFGKACLQEAPQIPHHNPVPGVAINPSNDPLHECLQRKPDFSKGDDHFIRLVTEFYKRYPSDRNIYIRELLECFANSLTVEEVHRYPFPSRDAPPSKP
jgi:hypothetical protein